MPKIYCFDVDDTLECSGGPIPLRALMDLRVQEHIVGICGNWTVLAQVPGWQHLISFHNGRDPDKAEFLSTIKRYTPAEEYIMVGNVFGVTGGSDDQGAATRAGWRFILERDFAMGAR